jgi:hypothetical protein
VEAGTGPLLEGYFKPHWGRIKQIKSFLSTLKPLILQQRKKLVVK